LYRLFDMFVIADVAGIAAPARAGAGHGVPHSGLNGGAKLSVPC